MTTLLDGRDQACVILAGGLGTRLQEALKGLPKCLAPVGERSFLEIQLDMLAAQGVTRFVLALGHQAIQVQATLARLSSRHCIAQVVEAHALGTGGAVLNAMKELKLQEALVANGDTFLSGSLEGMRHQLDVIGGECMRMAVVQVNNRARFGGVLHDGRRVVGLAEKGLAGPGLINAGLYRIHSSAFGSRVVGSAFSLETELTPALVACKKLGLSAIEGSFIDIGVPEDYATFCQLHG